MRKRNTILFILLILSVNIPIVKADGEGWLTGWGYRKSHELTGSVDGVQTDYQILLDIRYGSGGDADNTVWLDSKCKTDFGDIRFTQSDGVTELDYWIEIKVDSSYASIWVEVDSIPISPNTVNIYIYYNNSEASTTSNGDDTFIIFDECENNDDWSVDYTVGTPSWGTTTVDGYSVMKIETNAHNERLRLKYDTTTSTGRENRRSKLRIKHTNWNSDSYSRIYATRLSNYDMIYYGTYNDIHRIYSYIDPGAVYDTWNTGHPNGWYLFELWTNTDGKTTAYRDANHIGDATDDGDWAGGSFQFYWNQFNAGTNRAYIDWFFQGKYCDPEPTHTAWGSEEQTPQLEFPSKLFGAGFNASTPFVSLIWSSNYTDEDITLFEIQNSTDKITWEYLGQSTTTEYDDFQVVNGTERYYKIRACNYTGDAWDNSSFTDIDFEMVYFITGEGECEDVESVNMSPSIILGIFLILVACALIYGVTRRR